MTASGLTIGAMLVRRHRRGLGVLAAGLATLFIMVAVDPVNSSGVTGLACIMLVLGLFYLVAVCALGFDTDVAGAGSCYPARMFTLPVSTASLALGPLVLGATSIVLYWIGTVVLVLRPWGMKVPLDWPALLFAAQFAVLLALLWWPFGLQWARVVAGIFVGHLPITGTIYAVNTGEPVERLLAFLGIVLVIGTALAYLGVARSRCGVPLRWYWVPSLRAARTDSEFRPFRTVWQAQAWFEWRRHGFVLPGMMLLMVPLCLLPFFLDERNPERLFRDFLLVISMPVCFAGMAGASVGKQNAWVRDYHGLSSYGATRPVTTASMVAGLLRAAARSAFFAWALAGTMTVAAVFFSGSHREVAKMWQDWSVNRSALEVAGIAVVVPVLLLLITWKRLIENQLFGLTGREWIIKGSMFGGASIFTAGVVLTLWLMVNTSYMRYLFLYLPWLLSVAVILKFALASVAIRQLRRRRILTNSTLARLGVLWLVFAVALIAMATWLVPVKYFSHYEPAMAVVLMIPLARMSAMPLAIDWNRHR